MDGKSPESKVDALAFALALKESRKLSNDVSFHDGVYVEQYSRLLPSWSLTPNVDDEVVLGTWLSGGVVISTEFFRRLSNLTGWMPAGDLAEIVKAAGFNIPASAAMLAKSKPRSQGKNEAKFSIAKEIVEAEQSQFSKESDKPKTFKLPGRTTA